MFGPGAPPLEWDSAGAYRREALEIYYLSHAASPLTEEQLAEVGRHGGVAKLWLAGWRGVAARVPAGTAGPAQQRWSAARLSAPRRLTPATCPSPLPPRQVYHGGWPEVAEEGPRRYGPKAAAWVRVQQGWTLRDALARPDHVIPGVPAFFVLAKGTEFRDRFLEGDMPLL